MIARGNSLKGSYKCYILRQVKQLVEQIPSSHRETLAQRIRLRNSFMGCKDDPVSLQHFWPHALLQLILYRILNEGTKDRTLAADDQRLGIEELD